MSEPQRPSQAITTNLAPPAARPAEAGTPAEPVEQGMVRTFAIMLGKPSLLLLMSVLSIGPVAYFVDRMGFDRGPAQMCYAPLIWLHDNTFLEKPLEAYVALWGVR